MGNKFLNIHPLLYSIPIMLFIVAFVMLLYYTYARSVRLQKQMRHRYLSNLEEERKQISRELHDTMSVFSISFKNYIHHHQFITASEKETWKAQIITFEKNIQDINELLYPIELKHGNVYTALERLSRLLLKSGNIVRLHNQCEHINLSPQSAIHIYRILQESIVNIFKHTDNKEAILTLFEEEQQLQAVLSYASIEKKTSYTLDKDRRGQHILEERLTLINGSRSMSWEEGIVFEKFKFAYS
jgi:two-component system, NarL family, sensor kinase